MKRNREEIRALITEPQRKLWSNKLTNKIIKMYRKLQGGGAYRAGVRALTNQNPTFTPISIQDSVTSSVSGGTGEWRFVLKLNVADDAGGK